jgi:tripartite ATP-independent transporter DctM subunit
MKERGYKPGFAAALLASAGTIGPIIPPSMTMIVYGSMARVSIGGLFLGGIIPGVLIGLMLMCTIYIHSFFPQFPELRKTTGRFDFISVVKATPKVWVALIAPLIVLGGILGGIFTATEAGAVACFYSFIVTFFIYRSLKLRDLPAILLDAAVTTTMVVGIISVAGALGWLLSYLDFNVMVLQFIKGFSTNPMVVLFVLLATMLIVSRFVESLAVLILFVPVAIFVSKTFGFDPYQFGLLMVIATQIGAVVPPVAVLLFVATGIAGTTYDQTIKYCWPFIATLLLVLLLVALFPWLSSWIPHHFLG